MWSILSQGKENLASHATRLLRTLPKQIEIDVECTQGVRRVTEEVRAEREKFWCKLPIFKSIRISVHTYSTVDRARNLVLKYICIHFFCEGHESKLDVSFQHRYHDATHTEIGLGLFLPTSSMRFRSH